MSKPNSKSAPDPWDLRVRSRYLDDGTLKPAEVDKYLAALPDTEASSEPLDIAQPGLSDDEDDDESEPEPEPQPEPTAG